MKNQAIDPSFQLDPQLKHDCILIGDLTLCRVLLVNDAQYPWLILVPRVADISEIHQLNQNHQQQLIHESGMLSESMAMHFEADNVNLANLGNIVSQLHIHLIARFRHDPAWPGPVWGHAPAVAYNPLQLESRQREMRAMMPGATHLL